MNEYIKELFLKEYFRIGAVLGEYFDSQRVFDCLARIYMIPPETARELFALLENGIVKDIDTVIAYNRFLRLQQYAEENGSPFDISDEICKIIEIKGSTIRNVDDNKLFAASDASKTAVYDTLENNANRGIIDAMRILGILSCEGIFIEKNMSVGCALLEKTSRWNDLDGMLAALCYCETSRRENFNRLFTVANGLYACLVSAAAQNYGIKEAPEAVKECALLSGAIAVGKLDENVYVPTSARLIYGRIISVQDRLRILMSDNKELINETDDLPLKLQSREIAFDEKAFKNMPILRESEQAEILQAVYNSDLRAGRLYKEMCLCSGSDYVLDAYSDALTHIFPHAHVELIDAASLTDDDFIATKNNVFVRSCDEDKDNVYLIIMRGKVKDSIAAAVKSFLSSDRRKKFRLNVPSVCIDLSAILPICVCDKDNAHKLKHLCDVIDLAGVSEKEKKTVIDRLFTDKSVFYGLKSIKADEKARKMLEDRDIDSVERIVDKAVRDNRKKGRSLTITEKILNEYIHENNAALGKYGFGGTI